MTETKVCNLCNVQLPLEDFYKTSSKSGSTITCKKCRYLRKKKHVQENPGIYLSSKLKYRFGITLDEYNELFEKQEGVCAICHKPETEKQANGDIRKLPVDHCHNTNKVRGLLCGACNRGLGSFRDDKDILANAIQYLT